MGEEVGKRVGKGTGWGQEGADVGREGRVRGEEVGAPRPSVCRLSILMGQAGSIVRART